MQSLSNLEYDVETNKKPIRIVHHDLEYDTETNN